MAMMEPIIIKIKIRLFSASKPPSFKVKKAAQISLCSFFETTSPTNQNL